MTIKETYEEYASKIGNRKKLYQVIKNKYKIKSALYPGSHIDIAASLIIEDVIYVDNYKGAISFFKDMPDVIAYINQNKSYKTDSQINFIGKDYYGLKVDEKVELIISQYAGFVGQATKSHLKKGGILLCNDSHGDATLAYLYDDFELIGVIDTRYKILEDHLETYFKYKKDRPIDKDKVLRTMKGPKYSLNPSNYIVKYKDDAVDMIS